MSSNQNKGKGNGKRGKGGKKGQREETVETKLPDAEKEETPSDPITQESIQSDVRTQKEETPTIPEETTNTDASHREESSLTREEHVAEVDHQEVDVAAV